MAFNALLMCREQQALRALGTALDEVEMEPEVCLSAPEALDLTVVKHYSALVLDFDLPGAATVARMARLASVKPPAGDLRDDRGLYRNRGNLSGGRQLHHSTSLWRSSRLSAACARDAASCGRTADNRNASSLESLVYLQFGIAALPAMVLDLNQNGMALQAPEPLPPVQQVPLRFVLPGTTNMVEGMGEVIWADDGGRAGMLFSRLTPASRKYLKQWFVKRGEKKKAAARSARGQKVPARCGRLALNFRSFLPLAQGGLSSRVLDSSFFLYCSLFG